MTRTAARRTLAVALLALIALLSGTGSAAAAGWLPAGPLGVDPVDPLAQAAQVGYGAGAETVVVVDRAEPGAATGLVVRARPLGGAYATQLAIAPPGDGVIALARLAVAPDGAAVLGWLEATAGTDSTILAKAAYRRPDGTWEPPVLVADGPMEQLPLQGGPQYSLSAAIGADGTAAVLSELPEANLPREPEADSRLDAVVHRPGAGGWDAPARVSTPERSAMSSGLGVTDAGEVIAAWSDRVDEGDASGHPFDDAYQPTVRTWSAAAGWSEPRAVAQPGGGATALVQTRVGVGPAGDVAVAFGHAAEDERAGVWAVRRAAGAADFAPAEQAVHTPYMAWILDVAVGPDGAAHVLATSDPGMPQPRIVAARAPRGGAWTGHVVGARSAGYPLGAIGVDAAGATLAWAEASGEDSAGDMVRATRWQNGEAAPAEPRTLEASGPVTVLDARPDREGATAVPYGSGAGMRLAAWDGGGPRVLSASAPERATAGEAVSLSAAFADRWSGVAGEPTWDFGDGATGAGGSVTHAFATPGTKTVTVRARDGLGNETARTFQVAVAAAAAVPRGRRPPAARVALRAPRCARRLSRQACRRWLRSPAAWRVVRGTARGAARVEVRVARRGARPLVRRAAVRRGRWAVRLPRLAPGRVVLRVRALDPRGRPLGAAQTRRLALRRARR